MKKLLVALAVGVAVFAAAYASAATLGGLGSDDLGADDSVVASCDTTGGVTTTYQTDYNQTAATYIVTSITISNVDAACAGQTIKAVLSGASDVELTEVTATAVTGTNVINVTAVVPAENVTGLHVVISG